MKKTLKIASAIMAVVMLVLTLPLGLVYAADSGAEFYKYFDLSDISQDGEIKTTLPGGSFEKWVWSAAGGYAETDSQTGSKAWKLRKSSRLIYTLPEIVESGVVRISFDMKATGVNAAFYPGIISGDGKVRRWASYGDMGVPGHKIRLNKNVFSDEVGWGDTCDFTREEWHRLDLVADYTGVIPVFQAYYDGAPLISGNGADISEISGVKGLQIELIMRNSGGYEDGYIWLDNFVFSRFAKKSLSLTNVGDQKIETENGSIKLYLSERVDKDLLIAENVTLTHKKTGELVTNFDITPDENGEYFTISFNGEIPAGRYNLLLDESIRGNISGLTMSEGFEVRTLPKTVDGVEIPEISAIRIFDYKGEELLGTNLTSMISKAEIEFNRPIAESGKDKVAVLNDGQPVECGKRIDGEIMTLVFENLLEPNGSYLIDVAEGIAAADSETAVSEDSDKKSFTTNDDAGIVFFANALSDSQESYSFKVAKNTDATASYTFAICGYTDQTIDGEVLPQLVGMGYKAIDFSENDKGVFDYTISTGLSGCDDVKIYVWNYPSNSSVKLDENGKVK